MNHCICRTFGKAYFYVGYDASAFKQPVIFFNLNLPLFFKILEVYSEERGDLKRYRETV